MRWYLTAEGNYHFFKSVFYLQQIFINFTFNKIRFGNSNYDRVKWWLLNLFEQNTMGQLLSNGRLWREQSWWRHQMETFSALLAICAGNSQVPGEFPAQRPVTTRSFDVFFDLRLNKRLSKQLWGWWFETPSRPLWRHRNDWPRQFPHDPNKRLATSYIYDRRNDHYHCIRRHFSYHYISELAPCHRHLNLNCRKECVPQTVIFEDHSYV